MRTKITKEKEGKGCGMEALFQFQCFGKLAYGPWGLIAFAVI